MVEQEKCGLYAIFATGGKQYQAVEGLIIAIEKIHGEAGTQLSFDTVLFRKLGEGQFEIGQPVLEGNITASIVKQTKDPKLIVFKFKKGVKKYVLKMVIVSQKLLLELIQ